MKQTPLKISSPRKPKNREHYNKWMNEYNKKIRLMCLHYYGGIPPKCACCGEREIKFLSIDHIDGGGSAHRKQVLSTSRGGNICHWLKRNNFPSGFQILCHNCNMAKGFYGICPHADIIKDNV